MVLRSALLLLLVACSHFIDDCWAGPIVARLTPLHGLPTSEVYHRRVFLTNAREPGLWPRSTPSASNHSMWVVIAVVGVLLLVCILVVAMALVRKDNKRRKKSGPDEELGFGQNLGAQPRLVPPPRAYDGVRSSQSPPPQDMIEDSQRSKNVQQPCPPILTVSPPEESGQKPKRVPVPHLSTLSPSLRLNGLPPSPRSIGLPPSPLLAASPRTQPPPTPSTVSGPPGDFDRCGLTPPAMCQLSGNRLEAPLSAGSLERTMMQMEKELRVNEEHFRVPESR